MRNMRFDKIKNGFAVSSLTIDIDGSYGPRVKLGEIRRAPMDNGWRMYTERNFDPIFDGSLGVEALTAIAYRIMSLRNDDLHSDSKSRPKIKKAEKASEATRRRLGRIVSHHDAGGR